MHNSLKGILDRFEEKSAIIKTEDQREIAWPIKKLSEEIKAGDQVIISLAADQSGTVVNQDQAQKMLNEILNVNQEPASQ